MFSIEHMENEMLGAWIKNGLSRIRPFGRNEEGTILVITAICMVAVFTAAGAAMDYSRIASTKSKMNSALDSAVLAAGIELSRGETSQAKIRDVFENFFRANLNGANENPTAFNITSFSVDTQSGEINAKVETKVSASLMRLAGFDTLDVISEATSIFDITDVEVAMMLDVTGSMRGQKIADLKAAAKDAINILIPDNNTRGVRIGLVPYATSVNAGRPLAQRVTRGNDQVQVAGPAQFTSSQNVPTNGCVTGRGGRNATNDVTYRNAPLGSDARTVNNSRRDLRCPSAEVQPLTNNRNQLRSQIDRYVAEGWTAGHLGVAWSYYLLSENWRDAFNSQNKPEPYSSDVQKIAILMTDGEFNTAYEGIGSNSPFAVNAGLSNQRALDLCADMKQAKAGNPGIIIYSIAFQAPASAEATLRNCANADTASTTYFYSASSGQELRDAFRAIAASITNLRISG